MLQAPSIFISKCNSKRVPPEALPLRTWGSTAPLGAGTPPRAAHIRHQPVRVITWAAERWGWVSSQPGQAGRRVGWEAGRRGEEGPGRTWQVAPPQPVKACYTISPDRAPTLPVGKAGLWGKGKGGRLKPVQSRETALFSQASPRECPSECPPGEEREKGTEERAGLFPLVGRNARRRKVFECVHSNSPFLLSLTSPLSSSPPPSPLSLSPTGILEVGDFRKRRRVEA